VTFFKLSLVTNVNVWALFYDEQTVCTQPFIRSTAPFRLSTTVYSGCSRLPSISTGRHFQPQTYTPHAVFIEISSVVNSCLSAFQVFWYSCRASTGYVVFHSV
jgi:hypothetical protein